jgi:hypothetical protein
MHVQWYRKVTTSSKGYSKWRWTAERVSCWGQSWMWRMSKMAKWNSNGFHSYWPACKQSVIRQEAVCVILTGTYTFYSSPILRRPEFVHYLVYGRNSRLYTELGSCSAGLVWWGEGLRQESHQSVPVSTSVITERFYNYIWYYFKQIAPILTKFL